MIRKITNKNREYREFILLARSKVKEALILGTWFRHSARLHAYIADTEGKNFQQSFVI